MFATLQDNKKFNADALMHAISSVVLFQYWGKFRLKTYNFVFLCYYIDMFSR